MSKKSANTLGGVIRFHTKSKTGCLTCRKRRIKCDEAVPICRKCYRRNLVCVPRPKSEQESALFKPLTAPLPSSFTIDATSHQMFHHFMNVTASSLCSNSKYTAESAPLLPPLLFSNPVCMHATLAFTALHLGRLYESSPNSSSQNWIARASAHRNAAIGLMRSPSLDPDVHFMTVGSLLFYTVSAALSSPSSSPENIFSLVTLLHNTWSPLKDFIYADPWLKDVVSHHFSRLAASTRDSSTGLLAPLHHLYNDTSTDLDFDREELDDPDIREAYRVAVHGLFVTYRLTQAGLEGRSLVFWPALFGKRFVELLNERRQRALIILYYSLMILRNLSERCWWAREVGRWVDYVYGLIDERWSEWLRKATRNFVY